MPFQNFTDGLYLMIQKSQGKGVDHYGILDVGNRMGYPGVPAGAQPVVIHQTPPRLRTDWLQHTGSWSVLGRIWDEPDAIGRIEQAAADPEYRLFDNNCENFARYVATGKSESTQVQAAVVVAGLAALIVVAARSERA